MLAPGWMDRSLMSSASKTIPQPTGPDRRSILKAGAWSVPVVALAVAAPAASASTTANLALLPPQFGSSIPMFTPSLTQRYDASEPSGVVVGNTTSEVYTGPVILRLEVDRRLWDVTGFTYDTRDGEGARAASFSGPTLSDDRAVYTVSFAATVAPDTDSFTGILVRPTLTFLGDYPNDTLAPADAGASWVLVEPADAGPSDNVFVNNPGEPVDATPFGATLTADFELVASGDGSAYRPTNATLTSIGPNPTAVEDRVTVGFDPALADDVVLQNIALNGAASPDLLSQRTNTVSGGRRSVDFAFTGPLAEGDVVTFTLLYSGGTGATPASTAGSQIAYVPVTPNDDNQRGRGQSFANQPGS